MLVLKKCDWRVVRAVTANGKLAIAYSRNDTAVLAAGECGAMVRAYGMERQVRGLRWLLKLEVRSQKIGI